MLFGIRNLRRTYVIVRLEHSPGVDGISFTVHPQTVFSLPTTLPVAGRIRSAAASISAVCCVTRTFSCEGTLHPPVAEALRGGVAPAVSRSSSSCVAGSGLSDPGGE